MRSIRVLITCGLLAALAGTPALGDSTLRLRDLDGRELTPFQPARQAHVLFFVATDCPVSNSYAPEIQRVCHDYGDRGVSCTLVYEDVGMSSASTLDTEVRHHRAEYGYDGIPTMVDTSRAISQRAHATITPQAVVVDATGAIRYRGRIDNFYAALGKARQQVTKHDVRDALDAVLDGRPVTSPETEALGCFIVDPAIIRRK